MSQMIKPEKYILNQAKVIQRDCQQMGISPIEWIKRYAAQYHRRYVNGSIQNVGMLKKLRRG